MVLPLTVLDGACAEQREIAVAEWPDGITVDGQAARRAVALGLDVEWLARLLLTRDEWAVYREATAAAWAVYREATAAARAVRGCRLAAAWAVCVEATAAAWAVYEEATALALVAVLQAREVVE